MLRILIIFLLALSIHLIYAAEVAKKEISFIEKIRPTLNEYLGVENTEKIIGKAPVEVEDTSVAMPAIPLLKEDSKSISVYNKKADSVVLPKEKEEKYYTFFIGEIFEATRKQKPNEVEIGNLYNVLIQNGTREGIYHSLVLDSTYASLENAEAVIVKPAAIDFAVFFYSKYANKKINIDQFKNWNAFALKRVLAEKALDILDGYGDDRNGLESWYANLSSDVAMKFPAVMQNKVRQNKSAKYHKAWAQKAPIQHIKSETLIKLHTGLNSLM